jgi:hypothetical protein
MENFAQMVIFKLPYTLKMHKFHKYISEIKNLILIFDYEAI